MKGWIPVAAGTLMGAASYVNEAVAQDPLYSGTVGSGPMLELRSYTDIEFGGEGLLSLRPIYLFKAFPKAGKTTFWAYVGENMGYDISKQPFWGAGLLLEVAPDGSNTHLHMLPTIEGSGTKLEGGSVYTTFEFYKFFMDCNPSVKFCPDGPQYSAAFNAGRKIGKFDAALSSTYNREGLGPVYARLARNIDGFYVDLGAGVDPQKPSNVSFRFSISGAIGESRSAKVKSVKPKPPKPQLLGTSSGHSRFGLQADYHDRRHRRNANKCAYENWDANANYRRRGR